MPSCNSDHKSSIQQNEGYKEGFVESERVKLQYLDWGGSGPVLVLIPGLGDTPFLFENLADGLSVHSHVISYSRRNHGKSVATNDKYDNATLVADLKLLLDSLHIEKASLLGWSMGGNEITEFASLYPERVNKLIYFEAGYDLADGGFERLIKNMPQEFLPDSAVMQSFDNYRKWYQHFWFGDVQWNTALENNLLASVRLRSDSSIESIPNDDTFRAILKEAMSYTRRYTSVQAPSLVIFTKPFFYPADDKPETKHLYDELERTIVSPWREANEKRIRAELRNSIIVEAPSGTHTSFAFLSNDFLVKEITSFLVGK
jgi:pimeloyl-ACP methyl ester carboxylesterase